MKQYKSDILLNIYYDFNTTTVGIRIRISNACKEQNARRKFFAGGIISATQLILVWPGKDIAFSCHQQ